MSSSALILHLIAAVLFLLLSSSAATDHIVGANKGWNPGINYTLWANNHTFYVDDFISFRYQKTQYNVFEVNKTGYDNCTMDGVAGNWTSGKDFILLKEAKRYYFICGTGGCFNGMKVSVLVHPLPSPPKSAMSAEHSSKDSSAPTAVHGRGRAVLGVLLSVALSVWLGSGWI